jgi:Ca2+-binding EF-hand superfamily protein
MVDKAFNYMDKDGSGKIDIKDIINVYDVTKNKEFLEKKKTKEEIIKDFLSNFEGVKGNKDGYITK